MVVWEKLGAHRRWMIGAGLLLVALAGYFGWHGWQAHETAVKQAQRPPTAIPVRVVTVRTADFPVYLKGLGTVQPFDTVTVKSRVDGQVVKVAFKQGDMVKEGDILIQIDPKPYQAALDQALAKKAQDEANLKNAETNLERYGDLAKRDFASRQQVDTQQASVDQLTAQLKGDEAMIDSAQTQLDYATIRSPLTGRTGFRLVDPGNIVHANDTTGMVSIVRMQPISVVFTAPEENVPDVTKALAAGTVPADALSSDGKKVLSKGKLALVNNEVDQASGTIRMKASFDNNDNALWPGLSVTTRILVRTVKNATVMAQDAIQHGPNGLFVFVVGPDNKVQTREIKVAEQDRQDAVVTDGLAAGQKVVLSGQYRLQNGATVQPTEAEAPTAAAAATIAEAPPAVAAPPAPKP